MQSSKLKNLIDISNVSTYPKTLMKYLKEGENLFLKHSEENEYFSNLSNECVFFRDRSYNRITNYECILCFQEINKLIEESYFFYSHYTRLLDIEIDEIKSNGLSTLSIELINNKIAHIKKLNVLDNKKISQLHKDANKTFEDIHGLDGGKREDMVWVTPLKETCNYKSGIINLLNNWGGENIFKDERDTPTLKDIGTPSIVLVKFSYSYLAELLNELGDELHDGCYSIAYQIVRQYVNDCHNKEFEWPFVIELSAYPNLLLNGRHEINIGNKINVENIIEIYKLEDEFFQNTISQEIIDCLEPVKYR